MRPTILEKTMDDLRVEFGLGDWCPRDQKAKTPKDCSKERRRHNSDCARCPRLPLDPTQTREAA